MTAGSPVAPTRISWDYRVDDVIAGLRLLEPRLSPLTLVAAVLGLVAVYLFFAVDVLAALAATVAGLICFVLDWTWFLRDRETRARLGAFEGETVTVDFDDEGLTWTRPGATYRYEWGALNGLRESHQITMLMQGNYSPAWFPSRVFRTPDDRLRLTVYVEGQMVKAAVKGKQLSFPAKNDRPSSGAVR
jgi:hypothetical protein